MSDTKKVLLVIEDELPQRKALCEKFGNEGFATLEAQNGEEGLEMALKEKPSVIVLDVFMPRLNGIEMAHKLRQDEWGKDVPVIILSNMSDMERVQQAMEEGIFNYYVKSDTPIDSIVEKVKEFTN
tara:strand:- start:546 stop:923 length:378 start_codon:yes stop_codon:yes gene_type:complete